MENNWPETTDELVEECEKLISRFDLYTLGEKGEPFAGEDEPRVDGAEYLAGEYQYGVAMIPAQWVTHVVEAATLGSGTCHDVGDSNNDFHCSECGARLYIDTGDSYTMIEADEQTIIKCPNYCPNCGRKVVSE